MPPSVALNGQVTMIQVIKCLKCQQVQKPCHAFLMALYVYLCLCFRCFNFLLVGLVMSHPVEKRAAPPRTSLDPMLENEIGFAVCLAPDSVPSCWSSCVGQRQPGHANAASWEVGAGRATQNKALSRSNLVDMI